MTNLLFVSDMSDVYHPPERVAGESHCRGMQKYQEMYQESIDDPTRLYIFPLVSLKIRPLSEKFEKKNLLQNLGG